MLAGITDEIQLVPNDGTLKIDFNGGLAARISHPRSSLNCRFSLFNFHFLIPNQTPARTASEDGSGVHRGPRFDRSGFAALMWNGGSQSGGRL